MRGKEGAAEKEKVSEGNVKEEEASTAPLPDKVSRIASGSFAVFQLGCLGLVILTVELYCCSVRLVAHQCTLLKRSWAKEVLGKYLLVEELPQAAPRKHQLLNM